MKKILHLLLAALLLFACKTIFAQPGTLDSTFGINGIVTSDFKNSFELASSVAVQADGKIIVAGSSARGSISKFAIRRYRTDGAPDSSFGSKGRIFTTIRQNSNDIAYAVTIQSNGKIIAAGSSEIYDGIRRINDFAIVKYNTDGTPDSTFGINGIVTTDFSNSNDIGYAMAIQPDGKIVLAGTSGKRFAMARYHKNGSLDKSFGTGGKITTAISGRNDRALAVAVRPNGKIVVTGFSSGGSNFDIAVVRYNPDGTPDKSFGVSGIVTTDFGSGDDAGNAVALQPNGKIVVAGYSYNGSSFDFALVRYNADGSLDNNFGTGGKVTTDINGEHDEGYSLAIQEDGKILVGGVSYRMPFFSNADMAVARYKKNGSLDNVFGTGGIVITGGDREEYVQSIAIQPADGKIVAAGSTDSDLSYDFIVARYNAEENLYYAKTVTDDKAVRSPGLKIYPNPVRNNLRIEGLSSSPKTISVIDEKGKLLQQITTSNSSYSFNVKQLSAGMYFLRIVDDDKVSTVKFVKE